MPPVVGFSYILGVGGLLMVNSWAPDTNFSPAANEQKCSFYDKSMKLGRLTNLC